LAEYANYMADLEECDDESTAAAAGEDGDARGGKRKRKGKKGKKAGQNGPVLLFDDNFSNDQVQTFNTDGVMMFDDEFVEVRV